METEGSGDEVAEIFPALLLGGFTFNTCPTEPVDVKSTAGCGALETEGSGDEVAETFPALLLGGFTFNTCPTEIVLSDREFQARKSSCNIW